MTVAATHSVSPRCRVVALISGRGSNLRAILDATRSGELPVEMCGVISNNADAPGLRYARTAGVSIDVVDHREFSERDAFERKLMAEIDRHRPDLVVLAGFMRVLSRNFVEHYPGQLMNIHPSLLPAFPGLRTHERALAAGAKEHGATVHFVSPEVDAGPSIIQARVPVLPDDTPQALAERVLEEEHRIYPIAIRWFAEGRLTTRDGAVLLNGRPTPSNGAVPDATTQENSNKLAR